MQWFTVFRRVRREEKIVGVNYLYPVLSSGDTLIDVEAFLCEGQRKWPGCKTMQWTAEEDRLTDADIIITPDGASTIISHFTDGRLISVDGADFEEAVEIAAWVRSLNPDPDVALWFTSSAFDGHTVLTPGIAPQQVLEQWVDHREHDPYVEYPQYFS